MAIFTIYPLNVGTSTYAKPIALVAILYYGMISVNGSSMGSFSSFPQTQKEKIWSGGFRMKSTDSVVGSPYGNTLCLLHTSLKGSLQTLLLKALLLPSSPCCSSYYLGLFLAFSHSVDDHPCWWFRFSFFGMWTFVPFYHGLQNCRSVIESTAFLEAEVEMELWV